MDCRIGKELADVSTTALCDLPDEDGVSCQQFLQLTEKVVSDAASALSTASESVERAVEEIIQVAMRI